MKAGTLHELISRTAFAVSTEESRPILNGVLWQVQADQLRMVATNGHRLALYEVPAEGVGGAGGDFIIPPRALEQVRRVFPPDEEVEIGRGENHLAFRSPVASVSTRLIEGPYPNYDQVIPRDNDRIAIVDRASLVAALTGCDGSSTEAHSAFAANDAKPGVTLLNVSYDPTRELYAEFNTAFKRHWKDETGQDVTIDQSHGGAGAQARARRRQQSDG